MVKYSNITCSMLFNAINILETMKYIYYVSCISTIISRLIGVKMRHLNKGHGGNDGNGQQSQEGYCVYKGTAAPCYFH